MALRAPLSLAPLLTLLAGCVGSLADLATEPADSTLADTADTADAPPLSETSVVLVADSSNGGWLYIRPDTATIVHTIDLARLFPSRCDPGPCVAFGAWPSVNPQTGDDEAILTWTRAAEGTSVVNKVRLNATGAEVLWTIEQLDFVTHFAGRADMCTQTTACEVPTEPELQRECQMRNVHEVQLVEEDADGATLWVADTASPGRALKLRLPTGSTCAVVEDILSMETAPEWGDARAINDLDLVDLGDGVETVMLNALNTKGADGRSSTSLWRKEGEQWSLAWRFPEEGYLAASHNPDLWTAPNGDLWLFYADSNAMGVHSDPDSYTENDNQGAIGAARVTEDGPVYAYDAVVPEGFGFLRDVNVLEDGSLLVTDSGCIQPTDFCDRPSQLWRVSPPSDVEATTRGGTFDNTQSDLNIVEVATVPGTALAPLRCGMDTIYSSVWIPVEQLGLTLASELDGGEACPAD